MSGHDHDHVLGWVWTLDSDYDYDYDYDRQKLMDAIKMDAKGDNVHSSKHTVLVRLPADQNSTHCQIHAEGFY